VRRSGEFLSDPKVVQPLPSTGSTTCAIEAGPEGEPKWEQEATPPEDAMSVAAPASETRLF